MLLRGLGLVDRRAVMIVPWALSVWNVIITRTYLQANIPPELYDAGRVDGVSNFRMLTSIVIPLAGPIIAVITLFYAAGHWNSYFNALIYLRKRELMPLQIFLREILVLYSPDTLNRMMSNLTSDQLEQLQRRAFLQALIQYALIVVASAPVLIAYPFVQKYFVRGVMIGAIKG
jgi:putative aldouronate transport system permease protein